MNRNFLKELGLEDDAVDKIMAENGKDINKYKTDIESIKSQKAEVDKKLESYADYDTFKEYKKKYEELDKIYTHETAKMRKENYITNELWKARAKNVDIVKMSIDYSKIVENSDGKYEGLQEQIDALKKSDDYLFKSDKDIIPSADKVGLDNDNGKPPVKSDLEKLFYDTLEKTTY